MRWFNFFLEEFITFIFLVALLIIVFVTLGSLTGCEQLKEKAIAGETKGLYLDISIPSIGTNGLASFLNMKIGLMDTQWSSSPDGSKSKIVNNYEDINFWTLSGSGYSELSTENNMDTSK